MTSSLMGLHKRRLEPELMDALMLESSEHLKALRGLQRINSVSFSSEALWHPIKRHCLLAGQRPLRVLDVAAGAGDIAIHLTKRAKKENLPIVFEGCDFNPRAVKYANERARRAKSDVHFFEWNAMRDTVPDRFDAVISSLFLHHLDDQPLRFFLASLLASRARLVVFSDLTRSLSGLILCFLGTRLLSRSAIVHKDGILSVKAAFTLAEIDHLVTSAGLSGAQIQSIWPMRYLLTWTRK